MWSEIENKGKSKEKIRFGKGLPKWLSHRSTEVYRNSDPAEVPNRTEDFGRPLPIPHIILFTPDLRSGKSIRCPFHSKDTNFNPSFHGSMEKYATGPE